MFSHVAEETTRLSHGFLGALFGILLVMADRHFWLIAVLCLALYVAFVLNTSILHFAFRLAVENREGLFWAILLVVLETLIVAAVFVAYFLNSYQSIEVKYLATLRFGLLVYGAFLSLMNISHMAEILDLKKKRQQAPPGGPL